MSNGAKMTRAEELADGAMRGSCRNYFTFTLV